MRSLDSARVGCSQPDRSKYLHLSLATLASSFLLSSLPLVLLTSGIGGILLLNGGNARAESPEDVAKIAQAITVRIEGATQGSGILVKKSGNRYKVLTAWHVVSSQRQGEELAVFAPDGKEYQVVPGSIKRVANVDQAELSFESSESYAVATQVRQPLVGIGSTIFISGFPLPTSAVPRRVLRVMEGKIVASPSNPSNDGYRLLYSNPTMPGMSGGAILNDKGQLVGVHARNETQDVKTESQDVYVKTGTEQGVPISYWQNGILKIAKGQQPDATTTLDTTLSQNGQQLKPTQSVMENANSNPKVDYIDKAREAAKMSGRMTDVVKLLDKAIAERPTSMAYLMRANAKESIGEIKEAEKDLGEYVRLNSNNADSLTERGRFYYRIYAFDKAINDLNNAITASPSFATAYLYRGLSAQSLGSIKMACDDMKMASSLGELKAVAMAKNLCKPPSNSTTVKKPIVNRAEQAGTQLSEGPQTPNPASLPPETQNPPSIPAGLSPQMSPSTSGRGRSYQASPRLSTPSGLDSSGEADGSLVDRYRRAVEAQQRLMQEWQDPLTQVTTPSGMGKSGGENSSLVDRYHRAIEAQQRLMQEWQQP